MKQKKNPKIALFLLCSLQGVEWPSYLLILLFRMTENYQKAHFLPELDY